MKSVTIIQKLVARWMAQSPMAFTIVTNLSAIALFVTGLPELLTYLGVQLPEAIAPFASKTVAACALASAIFSKLTVKKPRKPRKHRKGKVEVKEVKKVEEQA